MKKICIISLCFVLLNVQAQSDFNLFFEDNPQYDFCMEMLEMDNGDIVALHQYENRPSQNPVYTYTDLPFQSFTVLKVYSKSSLYDNYLLKTLEFPCSDSLSYYGFRMFQLDDGRILIGGDVKTLNNNKYDAFIAITNEDLTGFDIISRKNLNNTTEEFKSLFLKENGNVLYYGNQVNFSPAREFLIEFDLNGNIINERYNFNNGIYDAPFIESRGFYFNSSFYFQYEYYDIFKFIKVDSNYIISIINLDLRGDTTLAQSSYLKLFNSGKKITNNYFLHGTAKNVNGFEDDGIAFYKFNENEDLELLYSDTVIFYGSFMADISYVDEYNIYFSISQYPNTIILYNIDILGQLNWKKSITFNDSIFNLYELQSILALKDNSCLISIGAKDSLNNINTFITRIDKNGNVVDVFTGIKDRNNIQFKISDFIVYPNPAQDLVQIESLNYKEEVLVEIYNIEGKLLLNKSFINNTNIDISQFETGVYFYQMKTAEGVLLEEGKLVKK